MFALSPSALALTAEGDAGEVRYSVYAPDWTWQGRDANVMAVLVNGGDAAVVCSLTVSIPVEFADDFGRNGAPVGEDAAPLSAEIPVPAGETRRIAVTGLTALHGHPRRTYPLAVTVRAGDGEALVAYPLRTIRGQAVTEGLAVALGVPIGVALIFASLFAMVLRNAGGADAWKVVGAPVTERDEREPWIESARK